MKKIVFAALFFLAAATAHGTHISGGELFYEYVGPGAAANTDRYKISMRLFRDCNSTGATLDIESVTIGIYATSTATLTMQLFLDKQFSSPPPFIQNTPNINPCITGNPNVCYQIGLFSQTIDLPRTADGYTLSWIRYTRKLLANVLVDGTTGATFTTQIPGTNQLPSGTNSSPQFVIKDTTIICQLTHFSLDFSAIDADGDSLSYKFTPGYDGAVGTSVNANPDPDPPATLIPNILNYVAPFSGTQPLGASVTINTHTGVISGIAPVTGYYVVCVVAEEWRNGVLINHHRKDFILYVGDCTISAAQLQPKYSVCNSFLASFQNLSPSSSIISYAWDFGDINNPTKDTSSSPTPTYSYKDTGTFTVKLRVTGTGGCEDSSSARVSVYPTFRTDFRVVGSCYTNPYQFNDLSTGAYGTINSWSWNFGDGTDGDTSHVQNPTYTYASPGTRNVQLISTSSKGCSDTAIFQLKVVDKPAVNIPFPDTLICNIDTLLLPATADSGVYSWSPSTRISNTSILTPLVSPQTTTKYVLTVNSNGCINSDSVTVNVLPFITVNAGLDTLICKTDTIRLGTTSAALSYQWQSTPQVAVNNVKNPLVAPLVNTKYYVTANLGKCQALDSVSVTVAPYPTVSGSGDTVICYGSRTQLHGVAGGQTYRWTPTSSLINANSLAPIAGPEKTTAYILTVQNTTGCRKPVSDTVVVGVIPLFSVSAGVDTVIVAGQPLQLQAAASTAGVTYSWTPTTGLSDPSIGNPVATITPPPDSITYTVRATTPEGCVAQDAMTVRIFSGGSSIYVPSAFTPNGDGRNDIIRPIVAGLTRLEYFRVYNRWGQLLFSTGEIGKGWDGNFNGAPQPSGTYVFIAQGVDYQNNTVKAKGTIVLIR